MAVCIAETTLQGQEAAHIYTRDLGVRNTGTPQELPCSSVAQTFHQEHLAARDRTSHASWTQGSEDGRQRCQEQLERLWI